jgi:hypothetical protein
MRTDGKGRPKETSLGILNAEVRKKTQKDAHEECPGQREEKGRRLRDVGACEALQTFFAIGGKANCPLVMDVD